MSCSVFVRVVRSIRKRSRFKQRQLVHPWFEPSQLPHLNATLPAKRASHWLGEIESGFAAKAIVQKNERPAGSTGSRYFNYSDSSESARLLLSE